MECVGGLEPGKCFSLREQNALVFSSQKGQVFVMEKALGIFPNGYSLAKIHK